MNRARRHARTCERKRGYPSRQAALDGLFALVRNLGVRLSAYVVYRCTACRGWHYGHRR